MTELEIWDYDDYNHVFNRDKWLKDWSDRCSNCPAPCCYLNLKGFKYEDNKDDLMDEAKEFFTYDFVIMSFYQQSWSDNVKSGFNVQLNPPELQYKNNGLRVCPLAVNGKCIIYDDRPLMCREYLCNMKRNTIDDLEEVSMNETAN